MHPVICGIDESKGSDHAVEVAVELCREHGSRLDLVGLVRPGPAAQPAYGELVRSFNLVQHALARAASVACRAGVDVRIVSRAGAPIRVLANEAEAVGALGVVFAQKGGGLFVDVPPASVGERKARLEKAA